MKPLNSEAFWQFACRLYYLDSLELALNESQLNQLELCIGEFDQQVLKPLRTARAYLKANQSEIADYTTIRKELLSAELKLEKQQQQMLIDSVNTCTLTSNPKADNLKLYIR